MSDVDYTCPCAVCADIVVPPTDPLALLERLPPRLFSRRPPVSGEQGATFDDIYFDLTRFGPLPPEEPTPQYELARIFGAEIDAFRYGWQRAIADQHALGHVDDDTGTIVSQCPRAEGLDLDRLGAQFGIGRPRGFSDCCYWRLLLLLVFKPGPLTYQMLDIAQLYTGERPRYTAQPDVLTLFWETPGDDEDESYYGQNWYIGQTAYWIDAAGPVTVSGAFDGFWSQQPSALEGWWAGNAQAAVHASGEIRLTSVGIGGNGTTTFQPGVIARTAGGLHYRMQWNTGHPKGWWANVQVGSLIKVSAVEAGPAGNTPAETITIIDGALASCINDEALANGRMGTGSSGPMPGLTFEQALGWAKPAGVAILLQYAPPAGGGGCNLTRQSIDDESFWA